MDEKEAEARPVMGTIFLVYIYILYILASYLGPHITVFPLEGLVTIVYACA